MGEAVRPVERIVHKALSLARDAQKMAGRSFGIQGWVGIAANPASGLGFGRRRVNQLIAALEASGLGARVAWTPTERSALVVSARTEDGCQALVAAGGDGTVSALINEHPRVPITVLPVGTENLFARQFQISPNPERLAATIALGRTTRIDLGQAGPRRFVLMAGIGFDAEVVTCHHEHRIRATGSPRPTHRAAYIVPVLRASWAYGFPALTVQVENEGHEETLVGTTVLLFNLPRYALGLPFAPSATGHDGLLDLVVFRKPGSFQALHYLWLVWRGLHLKDRGVTHRRVERVRISAAEPVALQLDGDPSGRISGVGEDSCSIRVVPDALEVLVPEGFSTA